MKIDWKQKLRDLPAGLTYSEVASRIGVGYFTARSAMLKHHYDAPDGRWFSKRGSRKVKPDKVDWTMPNIAIAKAFKVSRERIRMIRKQLGKPFVESRGRKKKLAKPFVDKPRKNPEIDCIINMRDLYGPWTFKTNFTASKPKTKNQK